MPMAISMARCNGNGDGHGDGGRGAKSRRAGRAATVCLSEIKISHCNTILVPQEASQRGLFINPSCGIIGFMMGFVNAGWLLQPCVYLLMWRGDVVYVGQSRKPLSRLYTHASAARGIARGRRAAGWLADKAIRFDDVWIQPLAAADLNEVEKSLIERYQPKHNKVHKLRTKERPKVPIELLVNGKQLVLQRKGAPRAPLAVSSFVRRV